MLLALPALGYAQEATLTGIVTDSSGAVLPGVTVTAVNSATGNSFNGVTDETGTYRLGVRVGPYAITVDASGDPDGLACALRSTEPEGICTSIGIYFTETTPVPLLEMFTKGIRFHTGRCHARPAIEPLLDLVREGKFEPQLATGETAEWDDAPEAIAGHRSKLVISR
jgi:threonine dehydrogenase-like Zn-dependent dehydrogenase